MEWYWIVALVVGGIFLGAFLLWLILVDVFSGMRR